MKNPTAFARYSWVGLMTAASGAASLALACATPFPALAALAAMHVRRTDGLMLIGAAWVVSQIVGFGIKGYPLDGHALLWPVAMACAGAGSLFAAEAVTRGLAKVNPVLRLGLAYVAAYAGFKLVVLVGVNLFDHGWAAFSSEVMVRQFVRYGAILIGLAGLHALLMRLGLGRVSTPAARTA